MARSETLEAIILKTYDVGEADRFCVLFTREHGKITARAQGVRKLKSRRGGSLLAPHHVHIEIRESRAGNTIGDVTGAETVQKSSINAFLHIQQGIEILLSVLQDQEELPELFDATLLFLSACRNESEHTVLPFTLMLLSLMGLMPDRENQKRAHFSETQQTYIQASLSGAWEDLPTLSPKEKDLFSALCAELLSEITNRPLAVGGIASRM